ncbi:MAG: hypothetical protein H6657_07655 [Ardenticatenaceae bacterium]|nr:hypothetical protein [Ardenticatenaceae bacterium]
MAGDFQGWDGRNTLLFDDGTEGDQTAGDGLFARTITFAEPGRYLWRVLPCGDWTQAVPERAAWFFVTTPDQPITFTFRAADVESRFWPNTYALTANDTLPARLVAVGTFKMSLGTTRTPSPDFSRSTAISSSWLTASRNLAPIRHMCPCRDVMRAWGPTAVPWRPHPWNSPARVASEWVLFQYDGRSSRIAVLYQIPWWLGWLGFEHGAQIVAALALVGVFVLAVQVINLWFVKRPDWQSSAGCPTCQGELRRVNRTTTDYLLGLVGIPVRRYKCRQCGWQGRRIHRHH